MDDNNRRRRQNEQPYSATDPRYADQGQEQPRGFSSTSAERYRPAPLTTTSPATSTRPGGATAYSGYYQETTPSFPATLPANPMQYQAGYPQDQRQQQQSFAAYNSPDLMGYNVSQQTPQSTVYDSAQQFQARQPAGMQMLSDVTGQYFPNEPTSAPAPPGLQHHASSSSSAVYQQHQQSPADRAPLLQQGYPGSIVMGGGMAQNAPVDMDEEEFQPQGPGMEAAYTTYQTALKEIFQNIINGRLAEASQSLLEVSEWLLGNVGELGLTVDEKSLHADRIRLWEEFNTAWLGIFQRQKDMLETQQRIQHPQTLITQDFINKMAKDLIRMCDVIEKHGLIDYQYGVAEEQIIQVLMECLDLQEQIEGVDGVGGHPNPGLRTAPP